MHNTVRQWLWMFELNKVIQNSRDWEICFTVVEKSKSFNIRVEQRGELKKKKKLINRGRMRDGNRRREKQRCLMQARTADSWVQHGSEVTGWQQWESEVESKTTRRQTHTHAHTHKLTHSSGRGDERRPPDLSLSLVWQTVYWSVISVWTECFLPQIESRSACVQGCITNWPQRTTTMDPRGSNTLYRCLHSLINHTFAFKYNINF